MGNSWSEHGDRRKDVRLGRERHVHRLEVGLVVVRESGEGLLLNVLWWKTHRHLRVIAGVKENRGGLKEPHDIIVFVSQVFVEHDQVLALTLQLSNIIDGGLQYSVFVGLVLWKKSL